MRNLITTLTLFALIAIYGCKDGQLNMELPYEQLREGDLVFRRGRNLTSNIIVAKDSYNYSHIGLLHKATVAGV